MVFLGWYGETNLAMVSSEESISDSVVDFAAPMTLFTPFPRLPIEARRFGAENESGVP